MYSDVLPCVMGLHMRTAYTIVRFSAFSLSIELAVV